MALSSSTKSGLVKLGLVAGAGLVIVKLMPSVESAFGNVSGQIAQAGAPNLTGQVPPPTAAPAPPCAEGYAWAPFPAGGPPAFPLGAYPLPNSSGICAPQAGTTTTGTTGTTTSSGSCPASFPAVARPPAGAVPISGNGIWQNPDGSYTIHNNAANKWQLVPAGCLTPAVQALAPGY